MSKITFQNKVNLNEDSSVADINKVRGVDLNEIKNVVNTNTPTGCISLYAGSTAPSGWLICDGSAISRTTYSDLFSVIGTTYGSGDGSTTFNLPDLQGNVPVGLNSNDSDFDTLGETGGEKEHLQTITEGYWTSQGQNPSASSGGTGGYLVAHSSSIQEAFNVMQPYIVLNYIISY